MTQSNSDMNVIRNLVAATRAAVNAEPDESSIFTETRRLFRSRLRVTSQRGRKRKQIWKKNVFLMQRGPSAVMFIPSVNEKKFLTSHGLGTPDCGIIKINRSWSIAELENYIFTIFPNVPLNLIGFKFSISSKSRKIEILENISDVIQLEAAIKRGTMFLIPNRDIPINFVNTEETILEDNINDSTPTSQVPEESQIMNDVLETEVNRNVSSQLSLHESETGTTSSLQQIDVLNLEEPQAEEHTVFGNKLPVIIEFPKEDDEVVSCYVNRNNILEDVMNFYAYGSPENKNLNVVFLGESGNDYGGLTKEMFTLFWKNVEIEYFCGENIIVPYLPLHRFRKEKQKFIIFGKILNHMITLLHIFPNKMSVVTLLTIGNPEYNVTDDLIISEFKQFVTNNEKELLEKSLRSFSLLSTRELDNLTDFFSAHSLYELPSEKNIREQILTIAHNILVDKPKELINLMRNGISLHSLEIFWSKLTLNFLLQERDKQKPTVDKVINCILPPENLTNDQSKIIYFLNNLLRTFQNDTDQLTRFLLFVTGSTLMPSQIVITFTTLTGLSRRPIVHTCSNTLELPVAYSTFQEFKYEFNHYLNAESSFEYNQL